MLSIVIGGSVAMTLIRLTTNENGITGNEHRKREEIVAGC